MNWPFAHYPPFCPLELQQRGSIEIVMRFACLLIPLVALGGTALLRTAAGSDSKPPAQTEQTPNRELKGQPSAVTFVRDLQGRPVDPVGAIKAKAVVLIFVGTDCPIANRYAPEIERLYEKYRQQDVLFWLVYADPQDDAAKIQKHLKEYQYKIAAVRDPRHRLVSRYRVAKTPEATVITPNGKQAYRGRIDDRMTGFGKSRPVPTRRDLQDAIDCVLRGTPVRVESTEVIGCFIPDAD
jgi:hypothetical protein